MSDNQLSAKEYDKIRRYVPSGEMLIQAMQLIAQDKEMTGEEALVIMEAVWDKHDNVAERHGISLRTLQRILAKYAPIYTSMCHTKEDMIIYMLRNSVARGAMKLTQYMEESVGVPKNNAEAKALSEILSKMIGIWTAIKNPSQSGKERFKTVKNAVNDDLQDMVPEPDPVVLDTLAYGAAEETKEISV